MQGLLFLRSAFPLSLVLRSLSGVGYSLCSQAAVHIHSLPVGNVLSHRLDPVDRPPGDQPEGFRPDLSRSPACPIVKEVKQSGGQSLGAFPSCRHNIISLQQKSIHFQDQLRIIIHSQIIKFIYKSPIAISRPAFMPLSSP